MTRRLALTATIALAAITGAGCQLRGRQRTELGDLGWPHSERTTNHPTKEPDLVTVYAISDATTNAQLIAQCAQLGHLTADMTTLDATYGLGRFWTVWRPDRLYGCDLDPTRARNAIADFTRLPFPDGTFDAVVFDPPYKLNGSSHGRGPASCDADYGVGGPAVRWQDRMQLCRDGIAECARVLRPGGTLLVKCQDQVVSGQVRWQTHDFAAHAAAHGCRLVDQLHLRSYRPQPAGRRQVHARRNYSTLLICTREPNERNHTP